MKPNPRYCAITLLAIMALPLAFIITSSSHAESSVYLDSGLSYINQQNLQSNQAINTTGTVTTDRSGWLLGGRWGWQRFDSTGGYAANAQIRMDRGLGDAGDIRAISIDGSWMHAIDLNWLTRLNLQVGDYQDDDQPAYNSQTAGGKLTLGWFGKQSSGLDLNIAWQQERYDDNPDMAYKGDRISFDGRYYFPRQYNHPYFSISAGSSRFDAGKMKRYSYDTTHITLAYNDWQWQKLQGGVQLSWRNNRFDALDSSTIETMGHKAAEMNTEMKMGSGNMSVPSPRKFGNSPNSAQNDTYFTVSLSFRYPFSKRWTLINTLNLGRYRSNLAADRPLVSTYLGIGFAY